MSWKIAVYAVNSLSHFGSHYLLAGSGFLFSSPSCVPWERFLTQPPVICFTLLRNSVCLDFGWSGAAKTLVALKEDLKTVTSSARLRQMDIWSFPCLFFFFNLRLPLQECFIPSISVWEFKLLFPIFHILPYNLCLQRSSLCSSSRMMV